MKWTIKIHYQSVDDDGKQFRATSFYQTEADDIGSAYNMAGKELGDGFKLDAIIPGHHQRF